MLKITMYLHEDVMNQQKVVVAGLWLWRVAHNARRWDNSKAVQFLSEGDDDGVKFDFSLSHSVEIQLGKPQSHPVVQSASTKANSRLHHVWVSHMRPTFHYPEVGLACETKLWQSDHTFYNANERFQLWNYVVECCNSRNESSKMACKKNSSSQVPTTCLIQ